MKKYSTLKILLIAILFTYLLTWLLPVTQYNSGLYTDVRYPAGLFDIINYPTLTLYYFGTLAVYALAVGAFYGIFNKTGVYRKVCDKIVKLFEGKEVIFFVTVIILLSVIVAFCGLSYELLFLLPLLTSIILLMGYDRVTVAMTLIGSIVVGFAGSLYANGIVGTYIDTLGTTYNDLILFRLIMLVLGMGLLILNVILHIKKKDKKKTEEDKELIASKIELKNSKGGKKASWPAIVIFDLIVLLMILGTINFSGAFKIEVFETFHEKVMSFAIRDYQLFAKILGSTLSKGSLGNWSSIEFTIILVLATFVLGLIYRIKLDDLFDSAKEGIKKFAMSAFLMVMTYTVLIAVTNHPIVLTILRPLLEVTNGFNSVTLSISMFIASIFNIDVFYTSSAMLPYITSIIEDTSVYPLVGFIAQVMHGLAMLIAPTSVVLLGINSYLKISYKEWFKNIWKFLLELFVVAFILFIIALI